MFPSLLQKHGTSAEAAQLHSNVHTGVFIVSMIFLLIGCFTELRNILVAAMHWMVWSLLEVKL